MPPEPLPWDRRDFRKHERSGSDPRLGGGGFGGGGPHRWREQHHHPHAPPPHPPPYHHHQQQQQQQRWYSDFRSSRPLPPGHGKQAGWHMYPDDAGHGFMPFGSRYGDRNLEDENCRPFGSRGDGRYFRNSRENRGSFAQKDWKAPSWEAAASPNGPGRPTTEVNNLRSIENTQTCHDSSSSKSSDASQPPSNSANLSNQSQSLVKENYDKNVITADGRTSSDQKTEKENCLGSTDWKPLKWTRSGSLTSRGSGFSHSSSSKTIGVDSTETVAEVVPKNATPIQSPSAEAVACVISTAVVQFDETGSRKKPRLGWGEGLAKYEKKKVEGPEDDATKNELVFNETNTETMQSPAANLSDKSPAAPSLSDCASPSTPSSVACSSSPGIEEKESIKEANVNHDTTISSSSPSIVSQTHYDGPNFNLENLELASIVNLSSLINELLQSDDPSSAETGYVQTTSINKLLVWKVEILKALEITESEIDSLETELKSLIAESGRCCPHPAGSSSLPGGCKLKPCEGLVTASSFTIRPATLHGVSSREMIVEDVPVALEDEHAVSKDEDIDSPGSATSKLVEVLPAVEGIFPSETAEHMEGCVNQLVGNSSNLDENRPMNGLSDEGNSGYVDNHVLNGTTRCEDLASVSNVHYDVEDIYDSIFSSNKDSANRALEELNKLLPAECCPFDACAASSVSSLHRDAELVKEKFLTRKRFLRFKEKVLTLRFKVFQHFWKEGRLVSTRKLRLKTQKKFDPSLNGHRKNRSTSRSWVSSYAGGPQTVPADEVIAFVNGLLSESACKPCRNTLKMPALILDKEMKMSRFISKNGLVEDPCAVEKERSMINPWSPEEKEIFVDKLAAFGKDFGKISSFLDHKTVADCIEFYYKNHKSECFKKTRKNPDFMKQRKSQSTTYLVASGKRWNRESNAASLDMLGAASEIAANVDDTAEIQQRTSKFCFGASTSYKDPKGDDGPLRRSNSLDMYNNKRETVAADVLAGICGSVSSEAISSCITSSVDPGDGYQDWRYPRVGSSIKRPLTPEVTQNVDDECSDESCGELDPTDWTDEEKSIFIHAVASYGKDFLKISDCVRTRSINQCKVFFSKARKCLGLDLIQTGAGNAASGDVNGDGSDIEDGCTAETGTVNNASECEMEEDLRPPDMKSNYESDIVGAQNLRSDLKMSEKNNGLDPLDCMAAEPPLKNSLTGDSQVDDKPGTDFNVENKEQNGADVEFVSMQGCGPTVASSNMMSGQRVEEDDDLQLRKGLSEAEKKALVEVSDGQCGKENPQGLLLPRANFNNKTVEDRDFNSGDVSGISCAISEMKKSEPQPAGIVSHPSFDAQSSMQVDKISGYQKKADIETCSAEKSCASSLKQNGHLASVKSSTVFSVPVEYRNILNHSNASVDVGVNMHLEKTVQTCDRQHHLSVSSLSDSVESQIPRAHPTSMQTMKGISGNVNCKKQYSLQNVPKKDGDLQSGRHTSFFLEKCNSSIQQNGVGEAPFQSLEPSRDHPKPQAGSSSDVDKYSRKGDVKLFGKILISSQQKPNSCAQEADYSNSQDRKAVHQSLNLKLSSDQKVNCDSAHPKFDCNNYVASETIPVTSFGFWDGNRIQTGYPPLPDSALLLTKYPAAFNNGVMPPPLHGVVRSSDCSSNGVSVFPSRELSSNNGLADYQVLRNRDLQPFTLDIKQPQDVVFTEMQRRNRFDLVPGMQQQARGMLGIDVGRGGVLVGGQCSGVSDPVAAIRMHYAKAGQFSLQAGNVIKEDDRWRSNGGL